MPFKVTIDPGHGGSDPGALGAQAKEKDVNLAIAKRLGDYLTASGVAIQLTRPDDRYVSLSDRATMANNFACDYFISVHANAGGGKGTEVYALAPGGNGEKLANSILPQVVQTLGLTNRGVKFANFAVLRLTAMPAVLVETAFLDNPAEERLLIDPVKQDLFAKAIAVGFLNFVNLPLVVPSAPESQTVFRVFVNGTQVGAYALEPNARQAAAAQLQAAPPGTRVTIVSSLDNSTIFDQTVPIPDPGLSPYLTMNLRSISGLTGENITEFIRSVHADSPLAPLGPQFVLAEQKNGINAQFLASLAILEAGWYASSAWAQEDKNLFGYHLGKPDGKFSSWEECIDKVSAAIVQNYLLPGGPYYRGATLQGMSENYSTDEAWAQGVAGIMARMRSIYQEPQPWPGPIAPPISDPGQNQPDPALLDAYGKALFALVADIYRKLNQGT